MRILLASPIDAAAIAALESGHDVVRALGADEDQLCELAASSDVLVFRSGVQITSRVITGGSRLSLLLRAGSGLDNVDLESALRQHVPVVRVPGSSAQPVAELTFALMLSLARNVTLADRLLRQGHWPKPELGGPLLAGRTLGVVGAGNIGSRVGRLGAAWGMEVLGCVATPTTAVESRLRAVGVALTDFDTVVARADFLCLHVPLDAGTRHLVDAHVMARMKPGSYLVNVARGGVVDETALLAHLVSRSTLVGAALDVHEHEGEGTVSPLADLPNVVLTPHIGAMALDAQRLIGERVVELIAAHDDDRLDDVLRPEERAGMDEAVREIAS